MNLLLPKLPSPVGEDLLRGILEAIDVDSYRAEARAQMAIQLADADAEVEPVPTGGIGGKSESEMPLTSSASSPLAGAFLFFSIPVVGSRPNMAAVARRRRGHQHGYDILKKIFFAL